MRDLVIVGDGGFAKEVKWLVDRINVPDPIWNLIGFIDNNLENSNVIGDDKFIQDRKKELYVAIAIGFSNIREKLYKEYKKNHYIRFANLIDPSVQYSEKVKMGEGNIICAGTIMTVDITIGNCNIINLYCTVGHDAVIDDFVTVNPGVNLSGNVHMCSGSNIGTGSQVIQGCTIGRNTIVGAGAVVNKDIPDGCTAVGVPAKVIK